MNEEQQKLPEEITLDLLIEYLENGPFNRQFNLDCPKECLVTKYMLEHYELYHVQSDSDHVSVLEHPHSDRLTIPIDSTYVEWEEEQCVEDIYFNPIDAYVLIDLLKALQHDTETSWYIS